MIEFLMYWVFCALGTIVWIILTETLVVMARGAAWFMEIRKKLGESRKDKHWARSAAEIFFLWWMLLGIWCWAAIKKRSLLEHMVWIVEDTERMAREADERVTEREEAREAKRRARWEEIAAELEQNIKVAEPTAQVRLEYPKDEDPLLVLTLHGEERRYRLRPKSKEGEA